MRQRIDALKIFLKKIFKLAISNEQLSIAEIILFNVFKKLDVNQ